MTSCKWRISGKGSESKLCLEIVLSTIIIPMRIANNKMIKSKGIKIARMVTDTNMYTDKILDAVITEEKQSCILRWSAARCSVPDESFSSAGITRASCLIKKSKSPTHHERWQKQAAALTVSCKSRPSNAETPSEKEASALRLVICHFVSCTKGCKCLWWQRQLITSRSSDVLRG